MKLKPILVALALAAGAFALFAAGEEGFKPLFDGKSLTGWKIFGAHGEGYQAKDGKIVLPRGGGGNLLTEKEYSNFILKFEFKLEEGSNNGLAIRSPFAAGDMAYEGMELQILDNDAERYKGILKPWQVHGSLYNVYPAETGALKPVGQWNEEEVRAIGPKITVIVNGKTILDCNIDDVKDPDVLKKHPGLKRKSGSIGFLGHNEPIEIRNIRIKEI